MWGFRVLRSQVEGWTLQRLKLCHNLCVGRGFLEAHMLWQSFIVQGDDASTEQPKGKLQSQRTPHPNPTPHTLHPTPYTLHPAPYTLHPAPYTLHPAPYILHPGTFTPNPDPITS